MKIKEIFQKSIELKRQIIDDKVLINSMHESIDVIVSCFKKDKKVLFCGNGGSAADAQHLAAEFSGRFYYDRKPLFAEALHVNTSYMTAVANDYSFDEVYARLIQAKGREGDILIGISTSGNSVNVIEAIEAAKANGMTVIGMTGKTGGEMREMCDILLNVPSEDTPRIQEVHILMGHIICQFVESKIFPR